MMEGLGILRDRLVLAQADTRCAYEERRKGGSSADWEAGR